MSKASPHVGFGLKSGLAGTNEHTRLGLPKSSSSTHPAEISLALKPDLLGQSLDHLVGGNMYRGRFLNRRSARALTQRLVDRRVPEQLRHQHGAKAGAEQRQQQADGGGH